MIRQAKITEHAIPSWKSTFNQREYEYLSHVINGLIKHGEFDEIFIEYGEQNGRRVLHIFEPFCTLNYLGYMSPSVVSISFNNLGEVEYLTGNDNGLGIFSTRVTHERTLDIPRNSTQEIDFWHFVDAIGNAAFLPPIS